MPAKARYAHANACCSLSANYVKCSEASHLEKMLDNIWANIFVHASRLLLLV